jgi:hypothetical protein
MEERAELGRMRRFIHLFLSTRPSAGNMPSVMIDKVEDSKQGIEACAPTCRFEVISHIHHFAS